MKREKALFGPGGNGEAFALAGGKSTLQAPAFCASVGLDCYEYEAGQGVRGTREMFAAIGAQAKKHNISLSFHAPYFISLAGLETDKRLKSIDYIRESVDAANAMGADTVVIHCGGVAKITREEGMRLSKDTLERMLVDLGDRGVHYGLETMGKKNQLGTLEEMLELCAMSPLLYPVVDFGHLYARECGDMFRTADDYARLFERVAEVVGDDKARNMHCHFSQIEYTDKGEKRHVVFGNGVYGPSFEPLVETIARYSLTPRIICESAGTQAEDALAMKVYYLSLLDK